MSVQLSEPVSIWPLGAALGEGPVWVARDAALWFTDIKRPAIYRYDPESGAQRAWVAPAQVGFVLPTAQDGFVAGLKTGLHRFDPVGGSFVPMCDPEPDAPDNRLNDATVDPLGRLWFGTMDDGESRVSGAIYRLAEDGSCMRESDHCCITNGPALSPDGRTLYHVDTAGGLIFACDVEPDGRLSGRRTLVTIPNDQGFPDGVTVDAEGCVWVGLYMGGGVRRYSPGGELLECIRFPVSAVTKIAFGGPELKTVFATTASKHLDVRQRSGEPMAGDLFRFDVSVPGLAGNLIAVGV